MSADAKPLRRWEYTYVDCRDLNSHQDVIDPDVIVDLDALGEDGWEAVAIVGNANSTHRVLLKREVQS